MKKPKGANLKAEKGKHSTFNVQRRTDGQAEREASADCADSADKNEKIGANQRNLRIKAGNIQHSIFNVE
jgi:hypothetical protein